MLPARLAAISFGLWLVLAWQTVAREAAEPGWALVQRNSYAGSQVVWITLEGVVVKTTSLTTVIRSPSRDVVLVSDSSRKYCKIPYRVWTGLVGSRLQKNQRERTVEKGGPGVLAGQKCRLYRLKVPYHGGSRVSYECWAAEGLRIPKALVEPLAEVAGMPAEVGMPLKIVLVRRGGERVTTLDTASFSRKAIPSGIFGIPAGYSRVENPLDVIVSGE